MDWYYAENGKSTGPIAEAAFNNLVTNGTVRPDTLVWKTGMKEWQPLAAVMPQPPAEPVIPEPVIPADPSPAAIDQEPTVTAGPSSETHYTCSMCGRQFPEDELIRYHDNHICADCKPSFMQGIKEGVELPGTLRYAGFWVRFGAKFIDGSLLGAIGMVFSLIQVFWMTGHRATDKPWAGLVVQGITTLLQIMIGAAYTSFFLGKYGATLGKMALGLKVVRPDGSPISYMRGLGRHFAEWISSITLGIGYLMVAFDDEKRALHDRICDTRVIRK